MDETLKIKELLLSNLSDFRDGKAPVDYIAAVVEDGTMGKDADKYPQEKWAEWANLVRSMMNEYHLNAKEAARLCAISVELGIANAYINNCDMTRTLEMVPYIDDLIYEAGVVVDMLRGKLDRQLSEALVKNLQVHSIISSLTKHTIARANALQKTLMVVHSGINQLKTIGETDVDVPAEDALTAEELVETFDCELNCSSCAYSEEDCAFCRSNKEAAGILGFKTKREISKFSDNDNIGGELYAEVPMGYEKPLYIHMSLSFSGSDLSANHIQEVTDELFFAANEIIDRHFPMARIEQNRDLEEWESPYVPDYDEDALPDGMPYVDDGFSDGAFSEEALSD